MANDPGDPDPTDATDFLSNALESMNMASPPPSAGSRVASIFELLEQILLDLLHSDEEHPKIALRTILTSQRTSQAFRNIIAGSKKLQRALYFTFDDKAADNLKVPPFNPMLNNAKIALVDGSCLWIENDPRNSRGLWAKWDPRSRLTFSITRHAYVYHVKNSTDPGDRTASWRRMYIYNESASARVKMTGGASSFSHTKYWENPKLGEIFDSEFGG